MPDTRFLTAEEVSDLFSIPVSSLYNQRWRRQAPGSLGAKVGRRILWRLSDLEAWFDSERSLTAEAV